MSVMPNATDDKQSRRTAISPPEPWVSRPEERNELSADARHTQDIRGTTLINGKPTDFEDVHDGLAVYIGRQNDGYDLPKSNWSNPYPVSEHGRKESINRYIEHFYDMVEGRNNATTRGKLSQLYGRPLACWCIDREKEQLCHGHVIALHLTYAYLLQVDDVRSHVERTVRDIQNDG